jgi:glycosyltransferase involved in cell wall biosynthesis
MTRQSVSIVIPVYNESLYLQRSVKRLVKALTLQHTGAQEIILVENGSRDDSLAVCHKLQKRYPKLIKVLTLGSASFGQALKAGINAATMEYVVIFNADFWSVDFMEKALSLMPPATVVVASKTLVMSRDRRPFIRRWVTYIFNSILRLIFNFQGTDTHGIKVMSREAIAKLINVCRAKNELLDTELIIRLSRKRNIYLELPIEVKETRPSRYNNWSRLYNTMIDIYTVFGSKLYDLSRHRR